MAVTGQFYYVAQGNPTDARFAYINVDASTDSNTNSATTVLVDNDPAVDLQTGFPEDVQVDWAAGLYFVLVNGGPALGTNGQILMGHLNSSAAPTVVYTAPVDDAINTIQIDPYSHHLYLGDLESSGDPDATGIRDFTYNPLTGAFAAVATNDGFLVKSSGQTGIPDDPDPDIGVPIFDPRDFALDHSTNQLFWVNETDGGVFTNQIYWLDLADPTVIHSLLQQSQFNFTTDGSPFPNGYLTSVEVDPSTDLVYFTTHSQHPSPDGTYNAATDKIYWINESATGSTAATELTITGLPGGNVFYPGKMTFDLATRQIYVVSEETDTGGAVKDDRVYVLQLSADGKSASWVNTLTPSPNFTTDSANFSGLTFDALAQLSALSVTSTHATEQSTAVTLLTAAPAITDVDGDHLNNATVKITGGTFSSNENSTADDHLTVAGQSSGQIAGTNITVTWTPATETLLLSGYDTIAHYQSVLAQVQYNATGNNPTNYGANTTRTVIWQINDGAIGDPSGTANAASTNIRTTTLNIDAVNDAAVISVGAGNSSSISLNEANAGLSQSQTLTVTDPDSHTQTISKSLVGHTGPVNGISDATLLGYFTAGSPVATVPTGTITYTFNSGAEAFNFLRATQQLVVTYNIHDVDSSETGAAASADQQVTVTVTGANDAASIASVTNAADVNELGDAHAQLVTGSGSLSVSDLDVGDTLTVTAGSGTALLNGAAVPVAFTANIAALLAGSDFSFAGGVLSNGGTQTVTFNYSAFADLDFLTSTDVLTLTFNAKVNDGTADSATQPITITIRGADDAPVITSNGGGAAATVTVDENTSAVTQVTSTDLDRNATKTFSIVSAVGTDFSKFNIDSATGVLTFAPAPDFENPSHTAGSNSSGNSYVVDVQVSDGLGGIDLQEITVNVSNVNEAPQLAPNTATIAYTENGGPLALLSGATLTDPDNPANFSGGSLAVTITDPVAGDELNPVTGSAVVISAGHLLVNGTDIGTVTSGGFGATSLAVLLNSSATRALVETAVQAIGFDSTSESPTGAARHISVAFSDGGNAGAGPVQTDTTAVTVNVTAVNDQPHVVTGGDYQGTPATPIAITGISFNDNDDLGLSEQATFAVASGTLTGTAFAGVTVVGSPSGSVTLTGSLTDLNAYIASGHLTFTGATNTSLSILIDDLGHTPAPHQTDSATLAITVDQPPTTPADGDTAQPNAVTEGAAAGTYVGLTAASTDPDAGDTVTYSLTDSAGGFFKIDANTGVVSVDTAGASGINYETAPGHAYSITVQALDTHGVASSQTFSIAVNDVAAGAAPDAYTLGEDTTLTVAAAAGVLANDTDVNGGPIFAALGTGPSHAAAFTLNADGSFSYKPVANYSGADSFTYTAGGTTATVSLTVTAAQDAVNDTLTINEDTAFVGFDVLANDTFGPGATITGVTQGAHSTIAINPNGTLTYSPADDWNGTDTFTYTATTAGGTAETATVTVTVTAVQDAFDDTLTTNEDAAGTVNVLANDQFSGSGVTITGVTNGAHGTVTNNNNGTLTFTPVANYFGTDTFTYTAVSATGTAETATVNVTVAAVNDAPVLHDVPAGAAYANGPAVILAPGLTITDVDGTTLASATVHVSAGAFTAHGDVLSVSAVGLAGTNILASYNAATETLTLSGTDTLAHYQQALENVAFQTTNFALDRAQTIEWQLNDGSAANNLSDVASTAISMPRQQTNDFNGSGHSGILWQHTDGTVAIWSMNGTSLVSGASVAFNPGPSWHTIGAGDFNGDGKADILWQNADGTPAIWLMDGTNILSGANVGFNPGPAWHVISAGDFDGDGKADILWQNNNGQAAVWLMDGQTLKSGSDVGSNPGPNWHVVSSGDFNGDGKADILWQNTSGQAAVWLMDGRNLLAGANVGFNPGADWHVQGAGDFNGDGKADILWQNTSGQAAVWEMNGLDLISGANVGFNPGPAWQVHGTGDFNGDGKADIEWQNTDGTPAVWLMDGYNLVAGSNVGFNPGANWHEIPPHHGVLV